MRFGTTTLPQQNQRSGADQRIKKTESTGTSPADVVNYFYQDGEVLYTTGSDNNKDFNILGAEDNDYDWFGNTEVTNPEGRAFYKE